MGPDRIEGISMSRNEFENSARPVVWRFADDSAGEYISNDIETARQYETYLQVTRLDRTPSIETTRTYATERDKIIEILKRESNINTMKYMYPQELIKEISEVLGVRI